MHPKKSTLSILSVCISMALSHQTFADTAHLSSAPVNHTSSSVSAPAESACQENSAQLTESQKTAVTAECLAEQASEVEKARHGEQVLLSVAGTSALLGVVAVAANHASNGSGSHHNGGSDGGSGGDTDGGTGGNTDGGTGGDTDGGSGGDTDGGSGGDTDGGSGGDTDGGSGGDTDGGSGGNTDGGSGGDTDGGSGGNTDGGSGGDTDGGTGGDTDGGSGGDTDGGSGGDTDGGSGGDTDGGADGGKNYDDWDVKDKREGDGQINHLPGGGQVDTGQIGHLIVGDNTKNILTGDTSVAEGEKAW
ncbi:hypothetical protein [Erwinia sp. E_sp_B04_7]|uniref:hypothetical protein n=1 Tax=unclassified Erwinia TaxID=2622719 RepID=UPI0030D56006